MCLDFPVHPTREWGQTWNLQLACDLVFFFFRVVYLTHSLFPIPTPPLVIRAQPRFSSDGNPSTGCPLAPQVSPGHNSS